MPKTKICAVQFKISLNFDKNISGVEDFFKRANKNNCDIICFPEIFLTGPLEKEHYNAGNVKKSKILFSKLSKNYGLHSIMGSIIEKINGNFYNISYLFDDNGKIIGNYRKNHLVKNSEAKHIKAGNEAKVFRTKIGKIGIQICRDLLYPEITRKMMLQKADIVFCPSFWCSKSSSYDWVYNHKYFKNKNPREVDFLVSARAIESETAFVYANAAGSFNSKNAKGTLLGRTQIALPFYGTTSILNHNKEAVLMKEIDLNIVKDARIVYKIEKDLKGYYRHSRK